MASPTVSSPPRAYYEPQAKWGHCSNVVRGKLFTHGGHYGTAGTPSHPPTAVEVFDLSTQRWEQQQTFGKPRPGFIKASSATIGTNIYYFAGHNTETFFNSIHCLDTLNLRWNEAIPSNPRESPIPKAGAAMFSYLGKRLVTFGGYGPLPATAVEGLYVPDPKHDNKRGWTSELHYFDIDNRTWTSPKTTGSPPPACDGCSLTRVDEHRAVLFGGQQLWGHVDNHVYILELQSWTWITVGALPGQPWPIGRFYHSAVSLHGPALMMMWGTGGSGVALSDAWNFSVNTRQWKKVILPDSLRGRAHHTTSAVYRDPTHKQLVTHGGVHEWPMDGQLDSVVPVTVTTIVELEHTPSRDWVVGDIIHISQTGRSVETVIQPGAMTSPTPQIEMEQLNQKLAKEMQEYKSALAHSQQTQQSLTLALAEKELQLSSRPAKMIELQATFDRERGQREEGEKQLKTKEKELHDMQLKVEELQEEKEKLEGQLQSTQDSITEIQEQLTPPEKMDQAIQTHREPSYLQISAQASEKEEEFHATLKQRESQLDWERRQREEVEQQLKRKVNELQLQIDELQEREKLAGQLQATGETALTTKETQEQLSQPEKMDHKGPLPATQDTGEATTTTKEIQEQLTPPEKRDQSVQTYTEPPFLQTSEALQLRGVHVVGETTFTATRDSPTTLNWEEYGFTLHIPEGALPPDVDQCHIHVKATIRGQFQLPDDHELVSAVFWIWCRHKLSKPATMEIEHCAAITTDKQCSALTFVRTNCNQEELPYTFVPIPEGVFSPGSCYGSISLSRFSGCTIAHMVGKHSRDEQHTTDAKRMKPGRDETPPAPMSGEAAPTPMEQTSPTQIVPHHSPQSDPASPVYSVPTTTPLAVAEDSIHYCAQLYRANKGTNAWLLYFVLMRDLKVEMQAVMAYYSGKATPEIESIKLTLEAEADKITLDIPLEGIDIPEGWKVTPCYCPTITKDDITRFTSGSAMPAVCELLAEWKHEQKRPHRLTHQTTIFGARAPRNHFLLIVDPTGQDTTQDSVHTVSATPMLTQKSPQQSSAGPPKPELKALVLIPVSAWYELGLQLDMSDTELDHIRDNYYKDSNTCKIEMFKSWLKKNPSSSYEQLVKALVTIGEKAKADNLCRKYGIPLPEVVSDWKLGGD